MTSTPAVIGYERASAELAASLRLIEQGRRALDEVPPLDPRIPVLVRARVLVQELRKERA